MMGDMSNNIGEVVGFAVMVRLPDGERVFVYSSDVDSASVSFQTSMNTFCNGDEPTQKYDIHVSGKQLMIQVDVEPLQEILEQKERTLLAADD